MIEPQIVASVAHMAITAHTLFLNILHFIIEKRYITLDSCC